MDSNEEGQRFTTTKVAEQTELVREKILIFYFQF
jgi:hypothetical protein